MSCVCSAGSDSPLMRYCGSDDVFCPANIVAPLEVHAGFYTADYLYAQCPPGQWRRSDFNYSEWSPDVSGSAIPTEFKVNACQSCPVGTFKSQAGDALALCRSCPPFSGSTASRIVCACERIYDAQHAPIFDPLTGECTERPIWDLVLGDARQWDTNTSLTRYQQFPCEPGHYCQKGLRYKCPSGRYGVRQQETDGLCSGLCAAGYFCLQASTSQFSQPCGGADWICAEGSVAPVKVPAGYYSNEDAPEDLRSRQTVCPVGHYCPGDGRRYACAAGTYTDELGTIASTCKGDCQKGAASWLFGLSFAHHQSLQATTARWPLPARLSLSAATPRSTARTAALAR